MSPRSYRQHSSPARWVVPGIFAVASVGFLLVGMVGRGLPPADAAGGSGVGLGTASTFAVLAGSTVTNTGPSVISGDVGLSPGSSITGFPPGQILSGTKHISDGVARQAKKDLTTAYNQAASAPSAADVTGKDLGGMTLVPGVYEASTAMALTGNLTLNAKGNPAAVFIFKAGTTLVTASSSSVRFINGGSPCNVYWQVGSSATLHSATSFIGTILAHTSATLQTTARVQGRVLAMIGAVTLHNNVITAPNCGVVSPTPTPTPSVTPSGTPTPSVTPTPSGTPTPSVTPSGTPTPSVTPTGSSTASVTISTKPSTTSSSTAAAIASTGTPTSGTEVPKTPSAPRIPTGHPHTGLGGAQSTPQGREWFAASALAGAAALTFAGLGYSRERATRRRRS